MLSSSLAQVPLPSTHASTVNYPHPKAVTTATRYSTTTSNIDINSAGNSNNTTTLKIDNSTTESKTKSIKNTPNMNPLLLNNSQKLDKFTINLGSRRSKLAIVQTEIVRDTILENFPQFDTKITAVSTLGDQIQNKPLYSFGGKSLWTKELEILLYESVGTFDKIDMIVHSLKDMPTNLPEGFELGCILKREDPRDVLILKPGSPYKSLSELPAGSIIGTSSVRRSAQLLKNFPNLQFQSIRGNIQTRISKLDNPDSEYLGILLAAAGLLRSGLGYRITEYLNQDVMYHSVGQGALGIEIRANDQFVKSICTKIRDDTTMYCCLAERSMLRFLEGGCSVPIGCVTDYDSESQQLTMNAIVVSVDGSNFVEVTHKLKVSTDDDAEKFGCIVGQKFLDNGAKLILDAIDYDRINEIKQEGITITSTTASLVNTP